MSKEIMNYQKYFLAETCHLIFINGKFDSTISDLLPQGMCLQQENESTYKIIVESSIEKPLHFLLIDSRVNFNVLVKADVTLIEQVISLPNTLITNKITMEIEVAANKVMTHSKIILGNGSSKTCVLQYAHSQYQHGCFALSDFQNQNELIVKLQEEYASCDLAGFYFASQKNNVSQKLLVEHLQVNTTSQECFKGVLNGQAQGLFDARIYVDNIAQGTKATLSNKNILLSEDAYIDTRPQLEIYADDVKCAHGATVGHLDEDALYYLQSRGISYDEAKQLLLSAFSQEILSSIHFKPLKEKLNYLIPLILSEDTLNYV